MFFPEPKKGVTLIELLVVTLILSIFTLFLFTIYKGALDSWTQAEAGLKVFQNARIAMDKMSTELKSAIVDAADGIHFEGNNGPTTTRTNPTQSTADEIFFTALLNPSSADAEICEAGFWLDGNSTGPTNDDVLRRFYVTDSAGSDYDYDYTTPAALTSDGQLCKRVTDMQIEYWDDTIGTPAWVTSWDSSTGTQTDTLPKAVKITLTVADNLGRTTKTFETIVNLR